MKRRSGLYPQLTVDGTDRKVADPRRRNCWAENAAYNGKGYRLRDTYARDLLERCSLTKPKDPEQLVGVIARMTTRQREAMLDGVIGGDGVTGTKRICQDDTPMLAVITILGTTAVIEFASSSGT